MPLIFRLKLEEEHRLRQAREQAVLREEEERRRVARNSAPTANVAAPAPASADTAGERVAPPPTAFHWKKSSRTSRGLSDRLSHNHIGISAQKSSPQTFSLTKKRVFIIDFIKIDSRDLVNLVSLFLVIFSHQDNGGIKLSFTNDESKMKQNEKKKQLTKFQLGFPSSIKNK